MKRKHLVIRKYIKIQSEVELLIHIKSHYEK